MKKATLILLLVLPVLFLCGLIVYRKNHSWAEPAQELPDNRLATTTNPNYVKQQKDWVTNQFDPLFGAVNIPDKIKSLSIRCTDMQQSDVNSNELYASITRVVNSLLSKTFDEYFSLRSDGESILIDENIVAWQGKAIQRLHGIQDLPSNPFDLHELYWSKMTENGKRASFWSNASWQASWIECRKTTQIDIFTSMEAFSESLITNYPNCGIVGYPSSILYGPSPKTIFSKDGYITIARAYLLLKTTEEKAYPLIVQFYWASSCRAWLPTHLAVGYVGNRQFDPVF